MNEDKEQISLSSFHFRNSLIIEEYFCSGCDYYFMFNQACRASAVSRSKLVRADLYLEVIILSKMARKFTWKELSQLNRRENAHVAYRGKVSLL